MLMCTNNDTKLLTHEQAYDQYGKDGVSDDGHGHGPSQEDMFSMFFGGGGRQQSGPRKVTPNYSNCSVTVQ
jgi:DnaJ-class molecular chaperone